MKKPLTFTAIVLAAGLWLAAVLSATQAAPARQSQAARVDYQRQVQPILEKHCLECHSQDKRKGGLSLATYADALDGGRNGPAIRPGNSAGSLMVHRVTGRVEPQMPKDEDPLSEAEQASIRLWIDQGARATASSAAGAASVGSAAGARPSGGSCRDVAGLGRAARPFRRGVSRQAQGGRAESGRRRAVCAAGVSRRLGPAAGAGGAAGVPGRHEPRPSARRSSPGSLPTIRSTRTTGSRSGTTCCATKTA